MPTDPQPLLCSIKASNAPSPTHAVLALPSECLQDRPGLRSVSTGLLTEAAPFVARVKSDAAVGEHRLVFGVVIVLTADGGDTLEGREPDCFLQD